MNLLLQRILDGISDGSAYGAIALAMVLIHRATNVLNFAVGEIGMFCAFITWFLWQPDTMGLPFPLAFAAGILAGLAVGWLLHTGVMRPFAGRSPMYQTLVTIGMFIGIGAIAAYVFSGQEVAVPSLLGDGGARIGKAFISYNSLLIIVVFSVLALVITWVFNYSALGLKFRASADNKSSAEMLGISPNAVAAVVWAVSGGLGALVALLLAPELFLSASMMKPVILYAIAALIIGGANSAIGAMLGGIITGLAQHLLGGYVVGSDLELLAALILLIGVLLLRPQGLFGPRITARV